MGSADTTDVIIVRAMGDNYIYVYRYDRDKCFVVDPGSAGPVLDALDKHKLTVTHILVTHNHFDHVGGVKDVCKRYDCAVIDSCMDGEIRSVGNLRIRAIGTPGHTRGSVCYYVEPGGNGAGVLFTGDTMFVAGCGRIFECSAGTMYQSLQKLAQLPEETLVYPGHDYTREDYEFALKVEPANDAVKDALASLKADRSQSPHVPSSIGKEKLTNIFIRTKDASTFATLRKKKDSF